MTNYDADYMRRRIREADAQGAGFGLSLLTIVVCLLIGIGWSLNVTGGDVNFDGVFTISDIGEAVGSWILLPGNIFGTLLPTGFWTFFEISPQPIPLWFSIPVSFVGFSLALIGLTAAYSNILILLGLLGDQVRDWRLKSGKSGKIDRTRIVDVVVLGLVVFVIAGLLLSWLFSW